MRVRPAASNVASLNGVSGLRRDARRVGADGTLNDQQTQHDATTHLERRTSSHTGPATRDALIIRVLPVRVIRCVRCVCHDRRMTTDLLSTFSNQLADAVAAAAPSVVQVQGRRRPASGLVYADNVVLTTVRALGREDGLHVRRHDGRALDAELAGWDPTTSLAVLRVAGLETPAIAPARRGAARRPPRARRRALVEQRRSPPARASSP